MSWATSAPGMAISAAPKKGHDPEEEDESKYPRPPSQRKRVVVVGLGMVGIAFMYVYLALAVTAWRRVLTCGAPLAKSSSNLMQNAANTISLLLERKRISRTTGSA